MRSAFSILSVTALVSCRSTHSPPPRETIDTPSAKAMSHALLDAYDRADEGDFARALGPSFVPFDDLHVGRRDALLNRLRKRHERGAAVHSRTYREEHVSIGGNAAVFIGETVEHFPPDTARPAAEGIPGIPMEFDGWNTIVWTREDGAWKAASWQWVRGGLDAEREKWNATYREGRDFNPQPSKLLVEVVLGRKPGLAMRCISRPKAGA
jgi:hypothetical protein